jgi:hypothetical protein
MASAAIDVENEQYGFFADGGTVVDAAVRDGRLDADRRAARRGTSRTAAHILSDPRVAEPSSRL